MDDFRADYPYPHCYFHPREVIVGICALCLKEKLLVLASKQRHHSVPKEESQTNYKSLIRVPSKKSSVQIPYKVFALGSSFLQRLESRRQKPDDKSEEDSVPSRDDSFISIKFEGNGQASWDRRAPVVEHSKPRGAIRWRKRLGHLFQFVRWKRTTNTNTTHVGAFAGKPEGRKGWIRSLTKRRNPV